MAVDVTMIELPLVAPVRPVSVLTLADVPQEPRWPTRISPAARHRAAELGVDLDSIPAEPEGRITLAQVEAHALGPTGGSGGDSGGSSVGTVEPAFDPAPRDRGGPWVDRTVDVTRLEAARQRYLGRVEHVDEGERVEAARRADGSVSLTCFVLKACAVALREHPRMNASVIRAGRALAIKRYVHLGVVVDGHGVLIEHADARPLQRFALALSGGCESDDAGAASTFTVTRLRGFGHRVWHAPSLPLHHAATLGLGRRRRCGDQVRLPMTLAYDPRAHDHAGASAFLDTLAELLADPLTMLLRV